VPTVLPKAHLIRMLRPGNPLVDTPLTCLRFDRGLGRSDEVPKRYPVSEFPYDIGEGPGE